MTNNVALNVPAAIDRLGALKVEIKALEGFLKSEAAAADFDRETEARLRAFGEVFEAVLSTTEDKLADVTDWEAVARKAGASRQLIAAHTERNKVVRKGATSLRVTPRKDVAAREVA